MTGHVLDRPVWNSLRAGWSHLALRHGSAVRLHPDQGPFAAVETATTAALDDLRALARYGDDLVLVDPTPELPEGAPVEPQPAVHQFVWDGRPAPPEAEFAFETLGDADAPEMFELAHLTKPGPYARATHRLGCFIGVRGEDGRLIAMAGERMKPEGFTEVSGVCTHPDHRGQGLAGALMRTVIARILARGETPFLHAYAANTGAIALYRNLGFAFRAEMKMLVLRA
jgi:ribosomal protein S18 acetylase RimI-like enzyme